MVTYDMKEPLRVIFDENIFISLKVVQLVPTYYTVIVWNRIGIFKHLLVQKYFIIVQLWSPPFRVKLLRSASFTCTK